MDGKFIGPMPVAEFVDRFTTPYQAQTEESFRLQPEQSWTADMSLMETLSNSKEFPNLRFDDPTTLDDATQQDAMALPHVAVSFEDAASSPHARLLPNDTAKRRSFKDPAPDENTPRSQLSFQRETNRALMHRRRLAYLILDMFKSRSRTFVFAVIVLNDKARLIRADRSGAVVTELFTWAGAHSPLVVFLRRFNAMSREERGFDPTVTLPSPKEIRIAREAFAKEDVDADYPDSMMQKFRVCDEVTGVEHAYVAGGPATYAPNVVSRGSQGYIAVDLDSGLLVWIKDSWRLNQSYIRKEADVYRMFRGAGVPHVASMVCGGDVDDQETQVQDFVKAPWACETDGIGQGKIHHRFVLSTIGRPLERFSSTRELTTATRDAIEAHSAVFTKLNILHGDISGKNIIITKDGRGVLIDWNLSIDLTQETRSTLTGTWQFISAALFEGKGGKPHTLQDDLESFVHVYVYHIVRYRPTGVVPLLQLMDSVYHPYVPGENTFRSSRGKHSFFGGGSISNTELKGHISGSSHCLVKELRRLFFRGIYAGPTDVDPETRPPAIKYLATSSHISELFNIALEGRDWARDDGGEDMLEEDEDDGSGKATTGKRAASAALGQEKSRSSKRQCSVSSRASRSKASRSRSPS
ncbi:hypothetical protein OF83DRAFT_1115420 [Amylostereum chailletii]|nr:hypothetical protein OF83DRAFT_1115420 [Amylostereum chailletii]